MSIFPTLTDKLADKLSPADLSLPGWFTSLTGLDKHDFKGTLQVTIRSASLKITKSFLVEFHAEILKSQFDLVDIIRKQLNQSTDDRTKLTADIDELTIHATPPYDLRFKTLPKFIGELKNLGLLSLRNHKLAKLDDLSGLGALTQLDLKANSLESLSESIGHLQHLSTLDLSENSLTALPASVSKLVNLKSLNVSANKLDKWFAGGGTLPQFGDLAVLDISFNNLAEIPAQVWKLGMLTRLTVSNNKISKLLPEVKSLQLLQHIDVSNNQLKDLPAEIAALPALTSLDISDNKFTPIPIQVFDITSLHTLRVAGLQATELPAQLKQLVALTALDVSRNALAKANAELFELVNLTSLNISFNQIKTLPSNVGQLKLLRSFNFDGNSKLKLLPRSFLSLAQLSELTVAGVRVSTDQNGRLHIAEVEVSTDRAAASPTQIPPTKQLRQLIYLSRSTPHPMLVAALAEKSVVGEQIPQVLDEGGLEDLIAYCKDDDAQYRDVSLQAIQTISENPAIRAQIVSHDRTLVPTMRQVMLQSASQEAQSVAITIIGNLGCDEVSRKVIAEPSLIDELLKIAEQTQNPSISKSSQRALAILGASAQLSKPIKMKRGLRILSIDGGGSRGCATCQMLLNLERDAGKPLHELFDLVIGTSVGSIIATMSVYLKKSMLEILAFMRAMCTKIFAIPGGAQDGEKLSTWQSATSWGKLLGLGSALKTGTFYMTQPYEELVKEIVGELSVIDTAGLTTTKLAITSTRLGELPPETFVFRNYNLPIGASAPWQGNCEAKVWQAIRASSAAPSYFEEVVLNGHTLIDGGIVCNNPTAVGLTEAKLIWPNTPVELVISVGTGKPKNKASKPSVALVRLANALIESCTDSEKTHTALAAAMSPEVYFRLQPAHEIFNLELDETRLEKLDQMQAAAQEYMDRNADVHKILTILRRA